jgi:hypothetical protein
MNADDGGDGCTDTEGALGLRKVATVIDNDEGGDSSRIKSCASSGPRGKNQVGCQEGQHGHRR